MYDIYIKNYDDANGEYQTAETLMFSVPMEPGEPNAVIDPKVNGEMGKAGSFEFSMNIGHPYYNSLRQMVTIFRVEYDGDTIFRGRVLTIDVGHLNGTKSVHCEGDYAFLLDSVSKGIPDDERKNTFALDYLTTLIDEHNKQVEEGSPDKVMYIGAVPGWYDQADKNGGFVPDVYQRVNTDPAYKYGKNSWRETQQAVNELADSFGGFFRTRYVKNQNGTGKVYLDWLDGYFRTEIVPQTIEVGENLVSISSSAEVNNIFTALIPVGKANGKNIFIDGYQTSIHGDNKRILVPDICKVLSDEQLNYGYHSKQDYLDAVNTYGIIYRVQTFDNADTQAALWTYAIDWIWNNYHGGLESFSIGALDMHVLGESSGKFLVGDRVNVVYPDVNSRSTNPEAKLTKLMTVMRATYVLYNPEKNTYEIGIPNAILKRKYGDKKSSSTSKKSSKASTKAAEAEEAQDLKNTEKETFDSEVDALLWQFVQSASRNSSEYNEYKQKYGDKAASAIQKTAYLTLQNNITDTGSATDIVNTRHKIVLDANKQTISMVGPANVKLPEQAAAVKEVVKMSLDGMTNKLTFKEIMDAEKEYGWWRPDGAARTIMELGANPAGGSIVLSKVKDKSETTEGTVVPTTLLDGLKGLAGTNLTLGLFDQAGNFTESVKDLVDKTGSDALAQVKAAVKIKGQEAKIEAGTNTEVKVEIAGQTGTAGVGKTQNGSWQVFLNDTVTYKDKSNQNQTVSGFVSAQDFKVGTSVNSLSTELLVVRDLIANKITANTVISTAAQIEDLVGQKASITDLDSATSRIKTLEGDVANIKKITANSITADTYVSADIGKFNQLYVSNSGKNGQPVGIDGDVTIDGNLTIKIDSRDYVNLKNALSNISSGGFTDGKLTVKQQKMDGSFGNDLTFDVTQTKWYADVVLGAQNAGIASAKISKWNDLTKSIRYENGKLKLTHHVEAIRKDTVLNENDEYDDVTIGTVSGVSNPNDFALEITDTHGSGLAYDTGWSDAFGKVSLPDKQPTGTWPSSISIGTPKSKWNTQADSTTYSLEVGSWDTSNNTVYVNLFNNTSQKNVARKQVNASTIVNTAVTTATENGRKAGWTAAYGKVSLPSAQNNTGSMVVKTPAETEGTTPNPVSTTYTLEQDDKWGSNNKKYVYIQNGTSEKNVARLQVDASKPVSDAKAAVTLSEEWKSYTENSMPAVRTYEVSNSANANVITKTLTLSDRGVAWTNNKKYVYLIDGTTSNGTNEARFEVDASTIVNTAATNATNAAKAAVTLTGSWSNGKYTVTNSANDKKASTKLENIALNGNLSSSNGKLYAPLKVNILDDNEDEVAVFTQSSLQLGSVSWTNKTITNTSGSSSVEAEVSIGNVVLTHSYAGTYAAADSDNETVRADGWAAALAALKDNDPPASGKLGFGDRCTVTVYQKSQESDTALTTYLTRTYTAPDKPTINAPTLNTGTINYTTKSVQGGTQFYVQAPIKVTTSVANLGSTGTVDVPIGAIVDDATITYDATTGKPTVTANVKVAGINDKYIATKVFEGAAPTATLSAGTITEKSGKLPVLAKMGNVQIGSNEFAITMSGSDIGNFTDINTQKQTTIQAKYGNYVLAEKVVTAKFTGEPYPILTPKYYGNALSAKMKIDAALNSKSDGTGTTYTHTASKTIELSGSAVTLAAKTGSATIVAKVDGTTYAEQSVSITAPNPVISVNTNGITEKSNKLPVSASLGTTTGLGSMNLEFTVSGGDAIANGPGSSVVQFKYGDKVISEKTVSATYSTIGASDGAAAFFLADSTAFIGGQTKMVWKNATLTGYNGDAMDPYGIQTTLINHKWFGIAANGTFYKLVLPTVSSDGHNLSVTMHKQLANNQTEAIPIANGDTVSGKLNWKGKACSTSIVAACGSSTIAFNITDAYTGDSGTTPGPGGDPGARSVATISLAPYYDYSISQYSMGTIVNITYDDGVTTSTTVTSPAVSTSYTFNL